MRPIKLCADQSGGVYRQTGDGKPIIKEVLKWLVVMRLPEGTPALASSTARRRS